MINQKFFELAKDIAVQAGTLLSQSARNNIISAEGRDIKHQGDRDAEQFILNELKSTDIPVLTEESGEIGKIGEGSPFWIIDPLDGTMNYSRNNPFCCVSIALWQGDTPLFGVIYDFNRKELFSGFVGEGAWLNEQPIHVSTVSHQSEAILATGFPTYSDFSDDHLKKFIIQVQQFKKIRMFGAAALSLAYVACGRVDAYMENDIMLWDVAAGAALVAAAGGEISVIPSDRGSWMHWVKCAADSSLI